MPKLALLTLFTLLASLAHAHEVGESYLFLEFHENRIDGRLEFRIDEVEEKLGVDPYLDGQPSVERLRQTAPQAHAFIRQNLAIGPVDGEAYRIQFQQPDFFDREGGWAQYPFTLDSGPVPPELSITYNLGFENDRFHRGVLVIEEGDFPSPDYQMQISLVFSASNSQQILDTQDPPETMTPLPMIWQGVLHIWIGIDHILFLIALALPIVLVRFDSQWQPAPRVGPSLWALIKIVTVFTVAHSITLFLASLDIITLPSRLVESVIALSIILVALNNFLARNQNVSLLIILALGLFHGLGFASVMKDLPFRVAQLKELILIILAFNVGVELGQIAILLVLFPLLYLLRRSALYQPLILKGGSAILIAIATYWFVQRAFGL